MVLLTNQPVVKMGKMPKGHYCYICMHDLTGKPGVKLGLHNFCFHCITEEDIKAYTNRENIVNKVEKKVRNTYRLQFKSYASSAKIDMVVKVNILTNTINKIYKCPCGNFLFKKIINSQTKELLEHQCLTCKKKYP